MNATDDKAAPPGRGNVLVWGTVAVVLGCSVAGSVGVFASAFADLYSGFGSSLPLSARLVLGWWFVLFALPAAALVVTFLGLRRPSVAGMRRSLISIHALSATAVVLGVLAMIVMYLPIFTMGEPV
jgi:hypothetical protein